MPEFQLDCGTKHVQYRALDEFTQGYFECAFFCGVSNEEGTDDIPINLDMLSPETWDRMVTDCNDFQLGNAAALAGAISHEAYTMRQAGTDFWFTRNGHGAGYSDRELGDFEEPLETAAVKAGECDLYLGDDGTLYLS